MVSMVIDSIDTGILRELKRNGRISYRELGEVIGLSATAAAARVERLTAAGVIDGFGARINRAALGDKIHVYIDVKFAQSVVSEGFLEVVRELDQIESARHITGPFDCAVEAWVSSSEDLAALLMQLKTRGDVAETETRLVLNSLKD